MTSDASKKRRLAPAWRAGLGVLAAVVLATAILARSDGALGRRSRSFAGGIARRIRALVHRMQEKTDRAGARVQDVVEVVAETADDLAHGPDQVPNDSSPSG